MFDDQSGLEDRRLPSQKLILPGPLEQPTSPSVRMQRYSPHSDPSLAHPHFLAGLRSGDPAYKVLLVAIIIVLLAGTIFALFASSAFFGLLSELTSNTHKVAFTVTPVGKVDLHPVFPTPAGNVGHIKANASPDTLPTAQPTLPPTATIPSPTPTPTLQTTGPLTLQIDELPNQVNNNALVPVSVLSNQPGVNVRLIIVYNTFPQLTTSATQITDANGRATLLWRVHARPFTTTRARLSVLARDQSGQEVTSKPISISIMTKDKTTLR